MGSRRTRGDRKPANKAKSDSNYTSYKENPQKTLAFYERDTSLMSTVISD